VAALHSTTLDRLDAITEDDDLADDFSLALNFDSRRGPLTNLCRNELRGISRTPKMKKTATFTCLSALDDASEDCSPSLSTSRSSFNVPCRPRMSSNLLKKYEVDADDNLVYCISGSPMSKRHRGRLGSAA
jgi:hypothetical protein